MTSSSTNKLSLWSLTALVVGSMIGAGIFSLPATFGRATGGFGAIIAWCIAGGWDANAGLCVPNAGAT